MHSGEGSFSLETFLSGRGEDPGEKLERLSLKEILDQVLGRLSKKESLVLRLNIVEGRTHSEIAELLKLPAGTVSSLIKRAKHKAAISLKRY